MFRELRRAALAVTTVGVVGLVPVASASALASTDPTNPAPSLVSTAGLSLSVTSNSVVGTATLGYSGAPPNVLISWGDGALSRMSPPTASLPGQPIPTQGKVVFQHVYAPLAAPSFLRHVSVLDAISRRELLARDVVIVPRYRVTQSTLQFSPLNNCDSFAENYTEWLIRRLSGGLPFKTWQFTRANSASFPEFEPIPDSAVSVETTIGAAPKIGYDGIEQDPIDDETFDQQFFDLQPVLGSRTVTLTYSERNGFDCRFTLRAAIDVQLLTPGYSGGPVASQ